MSVIHGPVYAVVVLPIVFSFISQGVSVAQCDEKTSCVNGKCAIKLSNQSQPIHHCQCDRLWFGANCSEFICDREDKNPCRNGVHCQPLDNHSDYQCLCDSKHSGRHCEVSHFNCTIMSCRRHGECSDDATRPSGYQCNCDTGFTGVDCGININDCEGVNCNNGICVDGINDYTCECFVNYTGRHCDHPDYCAIHSAEETNGCVDGVCCANGGTCYNDLENRRHECKCTEPWLPFFSCRRAYQPCTSDPCQNNGTCKNLHGSFNCACQDGFTGERCETNIDDCVDVMCENNGSCVDLVSDFECNCIPEYSGKQCQWHNNQSCNGVNCNNGTCVDDINGYTCECFVNYTGRHCDHPDYCAIHSADGTYGCIDGVCCANGGTCYNNLVNGRHECNCIPPWLPLYGCRRAAQPCASDPCHNNGTCEHRGYDYVCHCGPNFGGKDCSVQLIECTTNTCYNGGTCVANVTHYGQQQCQCLPYYTGDVCEIHFDPCTNKCQNNGTCESSHISNGEYNTVCSCTEYFTGENCTSDIDECSSNPCQNNATCINLHGSFNCVCQDGFTGERCETNIDDCIDVMCENNGSCVDLVNDFECNCIPEYSGKQCQWHTCNGVNCNNGTCVDDINGYTCECFVSYTGRHCDHPDYCAIHSADGTHGCVDGVCCANGGTCYNDLASGRHECNCIPPWLSYYGCRRAAQPCAWNPCQNNGTCEPLGYDYVCHCGPTFTGKHCDVQLVCTNKTCHNNGTCIAELTSDGQQIEHCRCTPYYAGDLCEVKLIHCGNASVCGGPERKLSCIEDNSSYYCDCKFGYAGERCEIDLDLCESSPCQNGGTCTDHGDRFTCQCQYGYTSRTCDTLLPVTVHPRDITKPVGKNVTITCKTNILGTLLYTWERKHDRTWTVVDIYNSTTFTTSTFGQYRCIVNNSTVCKAAIVIVRLQGILKISEQPKSGLIKSGGSYTLKCKAIGPGTLVYSWERKTPFRWITVSRYIRNYTTSSLGLYRCRVTNEAESIVSKIATVECCWPPQISKHPVSQLVGFNMSVTIRCKGLGIKPLIYHWEIRSSTVQPWTVVDRSNQKLVLEAIQSTQQVRCVVNNECGVVMSHPATIRVFKITSHPQSKQVLIGSEVKLICASSVSSSVKFLWRNNGRKVQYNKDHLLISTGGISTLFITKVKSGDAGDYVCEARCGPLSATSTAATLTVNRPQP